MFLILLVGFGEMPGRKRGKVTLSNHLHTRPFLGLLLQNLIFTQFWSGLPFISHVLLLLIFFLSLSPLVVAGFSSSMCTRGKLSVSVIPLRSRFQDRIKGPCVRKTN